MTTLLIALAAAVALGLLLHVVDGRFRPARGTAPEAGAGDPFLRALPGLGEHATFVQISAESCAVCPRVAGVLAGVAGATRGVRHVELRAEAHPDLLERYDVRRSPTVLVLDGSARVRARASGAVTRDQARAALADLIPVEDPR